MGKLHGLGSEANILEHFSVSVGVLQRVSLELYGRQRSIDLGKLLLVPLLSFQSLKSRWEEQKAEGKESVGT